MTIKKIKKGAIGVVSDGGDSDRVEVDILDSPEIGAPVECQISCGDKLPVISVPNKLFVEVRISNSVTGFIEKKYFKVK